VAIHFHDNPKTERFGKPCLTVPRRLKFQAELGTGRARVQLFSLVIFYGVKPRKCILPLKGARGADRAAGHSNAGIRLMPSCSVSFLMVGDLRTSAETPTVEIGEDTVPVIPAAATKLVTIKQQARFSEEKS